MNKVNTQLRIYVSKKYFSLFVEITRGLFQQNSEFFMLCTFLGEKKDRKIPLEKRYELCRVITLSEYDNIAIKSLYLKEFDTVGSYKDMIQLAEQYANGGVTYLIENTLKDYVYQDEDANWHLKQNITIKQFYQDLIDYVLKEIRGVPF